MFVCLYVRLTALSEMWENKKECGKNRPLSLLKPCSNIMLKGLKTITKKKILIRTARPSDAEPQNYKFQPINCDVQNQHLIRFIWGSWQSCTVGQVVNNELERICPNSRHYKSSALEGLRKPLKVSSGITWLKYEAKTTKNWSGGSLFKDLWWHSVVKQVLAQSSS